MIETTRVMIPDDLTQETLVLTLATLGLLGYGAYAVVRPVIDLLVGPRLELWAELGTIGFGFLLALSAAFVRVQLPGGLALALGALLGLQALAVHQAAHRGGGIGPQIVQAAAAAMLLGIARLGAQRQQRGERSSR